MDYTEPFYITLHPNCSSWDDYYYDIRIRCLGAEWSFESVEYSLDRNAWVSVDVVNFRGEKSLIKIDNPVDGTKVWLRAKPQDGTWYKTNSIFAYISVDTRWGNQKADVGGNIMSLIYGSAFTGNETSFPSGTKLNFGDMFRWGFWGPGLEDASQLILPATTLTEGCYMGMFSSCSLTHAPELPATTMAKNCYKAMFFGCGDLINAPSLPATTLADGCYYEMFKYCRSLVTAPTIIQATIPSGWPYEYMFGFCDNLETLTIENTSIRNNEWILYDMSPKTIVYKKENVTTPANPNSLTIVTLKNTPFNIANAKEWVVNNKRVKRVVDSLGRIIWQMIPPQPQPDEYFYIKNTGSNRAVVLFPTHNTNFYDQKTIYYSFDKTTWNSTNTERSSNPMSITTFFFLPAGEKVYLKASVPNGFKGTYIYVADENWNTQNVNFEVGGNLMSLIYSDNYKTMDTMPYSATGALEYLFYNDVGLKDASRLALPSTINEECYMFMFAGCTSLTRPPVLPSTSTARECYYGMFDGCTSLRYTPALLATTLAQSCYSSMFAGCTSLVVAPELPATALALQCYYSMFDGCSSLNEIKCNAVTTASINDTLFWTRGVAASGTFYKNSNASFWTAGMDGIPSGWTVVNL